MKTVLVTGCAGYIGSVLTRQLLAKGYRVRGFDNLRFGGESLVAIYGHPSFEFRRGDVRDAQVLRSALDGVQLVVHLAAIVGDPACAKEPDVAEQTNWTASMALLEHCEAAKSVERFVFASTCSNYGKMAGDGYVTETSPLNPVSLYARLKVRFEEALLARPASKLCRTALRFATVYGASPRMRFDLTVNEFMRDVACGKKLTVFGEQFWRPYCHVEDLARSCALVLESPTQLVDRQVFGVGDTRENYQKKMIVDEIRKIVPGAAVEYVHKTEDPRDYRVDFTKIRETLGFKITKTVPDGLREVHGMITTGIISDPYAATYSNI